MTTAVSNKGRGFDRNARTCVLMFLLTIGFIAYAIIRDSILEERYGKHNLRAHYNSFEQVTIYVVLLVAPLIGGWSAFRMTRASNRSTKINGWLTLLLFGIFLFQATAICWAQYQNTISFLKR